MLLLLLFCIFGSGVLCLNVLSPENIAGYINAPCMRRSIGPSYFAPQNGTAVLLNGGLCRPIPQNLTGCVVIAEYHDGCTYGDLYENMANTGALAAIIADDFPIPGIAYYMFDYADKNLGAPFLQASKADLAEVLKILRQSDYNRSVIIEVSLPDHNRWRDVFDSAVYFWVVRVILPLLFFPTCLLSILSFWETIKSPKTTMMSTKLVTFFIEGSALFLGGFFLAGNAISGVSFLPYTSIWFFYSGFQSIGMFTTVLVAIFYRTLNKANKEMCEMKDVLKLHPHFITICLVFFLVLEVLAGSMSLMNLSPNVVLVLVGLTIAVINVFVGIFMIREKYLFYRDVVVKMKKFPSASATLLPLCEHTGKWLIGTTCFMAVSVIANVLMTNAIFLDPRGAFGIMTFVFFARWGTAFTQIMALRWKKIDVKNNQKGPGVAVWSTEIVSRTDNKKTNL
eukprot:c17149_g1_i2.p1 GENE.c17149_g1_i2~~c17149_g1_i2.p1  ORF type:complete len:462 (+),score=81.83 c17149_g1_i2:31-1386(+)